MFKIALCLIAAIATIKGDQSFCTPDNSTCWPTNSEIAAFRLEISGLLLTSQDGILFDEYCRPKNELISIRPSFILLPGDDTISDIQKSITFIKSHNLLLSIYSTGHSYIGRSEGMYNYSFQINFKNKNGISYHYNSNNNNNNNDNNNGYLESLTLETGVNLKQVYTSLNEININSNNNNWYYLFTGGDCHTVGIGGFLMGGGHSPLSSYLGLGIDKVTQFELITSNGSYVKANNKENEDLYWALRGGGGGTFGIVLNITANVTKFNKEKNEWNGITVLSLQYPFYINENDDGNETEILSSVMNQYFNVCMPQFTNRVNGYFGLWAIPGIGRIINMNLIYIGTIKEAKLELDCMKSYHSEWQIDNKNGNNYTYYETFWDWEVNNDTPSHSRQYCFSTLYSQNNFSDINWFNTYKTDMLDYYNSFYNDFKPFGQYKGILITTHVLIGHNVTTNVAIDDTSITPAFRQARIYVESDIGYPNVEYMYDKEYNQFINQYRKKFQSYSMGSYFNENYQNNSNYANDYWSANHYQKLQKIKQKWDPKPSLFNCNECVVAA